VSAREAEVVEFALRLSEHRFYPVLHQMLEEVLKEIRPWVGEDPLPESIADWFREEVGAEVATTSEPTTIPPPDA